MIRRVLVFVSVVALGSLLAAPALAGSRVVAQKSIKRSYATVFLMHNLAAGHRYRIDVTSSGHQKFAGYGVENYAYVSNHMLHTGIKSLTLAGATPRSFPVSQPTSNHVTEWTLAVNIQINGGPGLTVRFVDTSARS